MTTFKFKNVRIESFAYCVPPKKVSSSDIENQLIDIYRALGIPLGTLEKLTGIENRYFYDRSTKPSKAAAQAGQLALDKIKFSKDKIGAMINCSVSRDNFEPATACIVHHLLGLKNSAFAMDITNACVGLSNGLATLASMIENGSIEAGIITSGEDPSPMIESTIQLLKTKKEMTKSELLNLLPVLTLGSAATALVLCHERIASTSHRYVGSVLHTASEFHHLCVGNGDYAHIDSSEQNVVMTTQATKLISNAANLAAETWKVFSHEFAWPEEMVNHFICHQVGKKGNENPQFYKTWGISPEKEFCVYKNYGNTASCAMPKTLMIAAEENRFKKDDKILLAGYGSGLNTAFSGIVW